MSVEVLLISITACVLLVLGIYFEGTDREYGAKKCYSAILLLALFAIISKVFS